MNVTRPSKQCIYLDKSFNQSELSEWFDWSGGQGGLSIHDGQRGPGGPDGSCGPYGPGHPACQGGPLGQVSRWSGGKSGLWSAWMIYFQKTYGLHALTHQIIEKS